MTKTIQGWTVIMGSSRCACEDPPEGDFCSRPQFWVDKDIAEIANCRSELVVPATLTYEVPNDQTEG